MSAPLLLLFPPVGLAAAIVGVIYSIKGIKESKKENVQGKGLAIIGLVFGTLVLLFILAIITYWIFLLTVFL
jgi:hypothetical protein